MAEQAGSAPVLAVGRREVTLEQFAARWAYEEFERSCRRLLEEDTGGPTVDRTWEQGTLPFRLLERLVEEEIVRGEARRRGLRATPLELRRELRRSVVQESSGLDPVRIAQLHRVRLLMTGFDDAAFSRRSEAAILGRKLADILACAVPTRTEQVLLALFASAHHDEAGAMAAAMGRESSQATVTASYGWRARWDCQWVPRGILRSELDEMAFSLAPGETADPIRLSEVSWVLRVCDRDPARQVTAPHRRQLEQSAVTRLLDERRASPDVRRFMTSEAYECCVERVLELRRRWYGGGAPRAASVEAAP